MIMRLYLEQFVLNLLFMGKIFVLITQFKNLSNSRVGFQVDHGYCPLPKLRPGKTRMVKQSRILRQFRQLGSDWKIRVLVDGQFTGIELDPWVILEYVRVLFRTERNGAGLDVVCIDGVRENGSDFLLRHRYFGWMRNIFWDGRPIELNIARSDSRLATKLRNLEGHGQHLAPFVDTTGLAKRQCTSPLRKDHRHEENPIEKKSKKDCSISPTVDKNDDVKSQPKVTGQSGGAVEPKDHGHISASASIATDDTTVYTANFSADDTIEMDSFVHAFLFVFALSLVLLLKKLF